ncbi:MAG: DUF1932 domain-containing protein [Alphaproteobacteria bacterium]|nr:DUF1932 domain-containing protein [Alphaproteobacteria bacterium]
MTATPSAPIVALMSPGDMGHSVGALLRRNGVRVITALEGRSQRTLDLARAAGIEDVGDDETMVESADMLLSIVAPAEAEALAARLAPAIERTNSKLLYADCNAVAPATSEHIAKVIEAAGARFVDAGIIGPPPRDHSGSTRFYASGRNAEELAGLAAFGLDVRVIGDRIGEASALKMCYAALNKGTIALMTGVAVMAERFGVAPAFVEELAQSQEAALRRMRQQVPGMVPKAHRWIGEMEEIAKSFDAADLSPAVFQGIAEIYRLVAERPIAAASPEDWSRTGLSYDQVVAALSAQEK